MFLRNLFGIYLVISINVLILSCLKRLQVKDPSFAAEIIKACLVVHNFRTTENNKEIEENFENEEQDENEELEVDENAPGDINARQKGLEKLHEVTSLFE